MSSASRAAARRSVQQQSAFSSATDEISMAESLPAILIQDAIPLAVVTIKVEAPALTAISVLCSQVRAIAVNDSPRASRNSSSNDLNGTALLELKSISKNRRHVMGMKNQFRLDGFFPTLPAIAIGPSFFSGELSPSESVNNLRAHPNFSYS